MKIMHGEYIVRLYNGGPRLHARKITDTQWHVYGNPSYTFLDAPFEIERLDIEIHD